MKKDLQLPLVPTVSRWTIYGIGPEASYTPCFTSVKTFDGKSTENESDIMFET